VAKEIRVPEGASTRARPPAARTEAARKRVVAAGVEEDQVEPCLALLHDFQDLTDVEAVQRHVFFAGDLGVDGRQVIHAFQLHAVTGIEE
jgi:hypothetical protein